MKLKVQPTDFIVEELTTIPIKRRGPYTLVKLTKQYWNTLDAIDYLARELKIPHQHVARAGLKDRYALSTQYLTIKGRVLHEFHTNNIHLTPIGNTERPISPFFLRGNRFTITLRDCNPHELRRIEENLPHIRTHGFVNYFDDQRFGSARHKKGFFAKALALSHFQGALKLLLCYPYKEEGKQERHFKRFCQDHWGNWRACYQHAPARYKKMICTLIEKPRGYKDAIKTVKRDLLNIYLLAYQSYLFNEIVREYIQTLSTDLIRIPYSMGKFVFFASVPPPEFTPGTIIPLLNEKSKIKGRIGSIVQSVMVREGIRLKDFALRKMRFRGVRFKPSRRSLIVMPHALNAGPPQKDELYPAHKKITITFEMPPGTYATLLIKRILAP